MYLINRFIDNEEVPILQVNTIDDDDIAEITMNYALCEHLEISLDSLQHLKLFNNITTLIIVGGMVTEEGMDCLYRQRNLETLVLDYEETESDRDAIELSQFPKLRYVLSRSNLNICGYKDVNPSQIRIEILNHYFNGKRIQGAYADNYNLFHEKKFLFLSAEVQNPASVSLIKILVTVENLFWEKYRNIKFSNELDRISIIPICMPDDMLKQGFGKERRFVSLKKGFADIRMRIPYSEFLESEEKKQAVFCKKNIIEAIQYIKKKDKSYKSDEFICALNLVFEKIYGI